MVFALTVDYGRYFHGVFSYVFLNQDVRLY